MLLQPMIMVKKVILLMGMELFCQNPNLQRKFYLRMNQDFSRMVLKITIN